MENYLLPDEKELKSFYLKKYGEEFLKLNNLKVGDRIRTAFPYEVVTQIPRSKGKEIRKHEKIAGALYYCIFCSLSCAISGDGGDKAGSIV